MAMYDRKAQDLSQDLFDSVYGDLFELAMREQKSILQASRRARLGVYYVGEAQDILTDFCTGKASLGDALDFIRAHMTAT